MDNHESYLSVKRIDYCKENGITIVTLPPHTSNKLQPLDRTVFGPFKKFFNQGANEWMLSHPRRTQTIYDLPAICTKAWDRAATPSNIRSGFRCTGIWPFDKNVFTERDFSCSYVTDRPIASSSPQPRPSNITIEDCNVDNNSKTALAQPGSSSSTSMVNNNFTSPSKIIPYSKAPERKITNRGPKRKKFIIATDTPERDEIANKKMKTTKINKQKQDRVKRQVLRKSSSSEDELIIYNDSSSGFEIEDSSDQENISFNDLTVGIFIVCRVYGKKTVRYYVAQIDEQVEGGYNVKFLKKQVASNRYKTSNESVAFLSFEDVVLKLPNPLKDKSSRYADMIYFNVDLSHYSII